MLFSGHTFAILVLYIINNSIVLLNIDIHFREMKLLIQYKHKIYFLPKELLTWYNMAIIMDYG